MDHSNSKSQISSIPNEAIAQETSGSAELPQPLLDMNPLNPPQTNEAEDAFIEKACRALGVAQAIRLLIALGYLNPTRNFAPYNLSIEFDNASWTDNASLAKGDMVDLAAMAFGVSRYDAALMLLDAIAAFPESERYFMSLQGEDDDDVAKYVAELVAGWGDFPKCLPQTLLSMAEGIAEMDGVPFVLAASAVIGAASGCLGSGIVVESLHDKVVTGNLYFLIAAPSGLGKTNVGNRAFAPIQRFEADLLQQHSQDAPQRKAKLAHVDRQIKAELSGKLPPANSPAGPLNKLISLEKEKANLESELRPPCLISGDATPERLGQLMLENGGSMFSGASDARGVIQVLAGQYSEGKANDNLYLSAYSVVEQFRQQRVGRDDVLIPRPCLAITWFVQGDKFKQMWSTPSFVVGGLLARFLCCRVDANPSMVSEAALTFPHGVAEAYGQILQILIKTYRQKEGGHVVVKASAQARKIIIGYTNRINQRFSEGEFSEQEKAFASRWAVNAWRLALVFHAVQHGVDAPMYEVDAETARSAVAVVS